MDRVRNDLRANCGGFHPIAQHVGLDDGGSTDCSKPVTGDMAVSANSVRVTPGSINEGLIRKGESSYRSASESGWSAWVAPKLSTSLDLSYVRAL